MCTFIRVVCVCMNMIVCVCIITAVSEYNVYVRACTYWRYGVYVCSCVCVRVCAYGPVCICVYASVYVRAYMCVPVRARLQYFCVRGVFVVSMCLNYYESRSRS